MAQVLFPTQITATQGTWTGAVTAVDETSRDDTDFMTGPLLTAGSPTAKIRYRLTTSGIVNPETLLSHLFDYTAAKDASGGDRIDVTAALYQSSSGSLGAGTLISALSGQTQVTDVFALVSTTLSSGAVGAINWTTVANGTAPLHIELTFTRI